MTNTRMTNPEILETFQCSWIGLRCAMGRAGLISGLAATARHRDVLGTGGGAQCSHHIVRTI
jgi:hypothetical protein